MRVLVGPKTDTSRWEASIAAAPSAPKAATHFNVACLPAIGPSGQQIVDACLQNCEADRLALMEWFGVNLKHFNVIIAPLSKFIDGTGGAFHKECSDADLYVDAKIVPTVEPKVTLALAVAELVEVCEALQGKDEKGWQCGATNGEGLSRVLAAERYKGVLEGGYLSAPDWLNSFRPDYVNVNLGTDIDPLSNGCSVLFLNYLHSKLGYSWAQICRAGAPNLAGTYQKLTGKSGDPFAEFKALLNHMYPPGQEVKLNSDNPWDPHPALTV